MHRKKHPKATRFFIEFRLHGYAKRYAKWVKTHVRDKEISHITLFGPAETDNMNNVIREIKKVCTSYSLIPFTIGEFSRFDSINSKVIYLDINPSPLLEQFRWKLANNLLKISRTDSPWDNKKQYNFHSTVKKFKNISDNKFDELCDYVNNKCNLTRYEDFRGHRKTFILNRLLNLVTRCFRAPEVETHNINQHLLRITILGKDQRIKFEYDLILNKLLSRKEALSRYWWRETIGKFRELQSEFNTDSYPQ
jgi:2'-5' RNA ligase